MALQYPVSLVVEGRPCLVVGGGAVARRKAEGLLACGAAVTVVAPSVSAPLVALPVRVLRRPYQRGEAAAYRLVIAATGDPVVNQMVHDDAEAAGVWVNAADDPARCTFTLPAIARQGPLTVAVSTGGGSPALASWLRDRLASELGEEYEVLLRLLSEARATIRTSGRSTEDVDWPSVLDSHMLDLIRAGDVGKAREHLEACLSSS
ncbi:MAG TPA: bifunctional precorrin-2 dehydrogenase/sirohydrochlorin ferrochelatase [Acidimicrobiales bacterium]|nr:bifunctional precorrin-2 dehydrogenase/sirohydrochlorin ferrochelatase [Acidimicrobiales bacterium]